MFLTNSNHIYLLANNQTFEEKFALEIADGKLKVGSEKTRVNVPCVFSGCNENSINIENFWPYKKVAHREFPIIFMIMLNKYQVGEKKKMKEFIENLQIKYSYRRLYGESGLKGVKNISIFIFNCGAVCETVKCHFFYYISSKTLEEV